MSQFREFQVELNNRNLVLDHEHIAHSVLLVLILEVWGRGPVRQPWDISVVPCF